MPKRRPYTDGLPSINGKLLLEYNRYQRISKSLGSRSVREKIVREKKLSNDQSATTFGQPCSFHRESLHFYCHTHKEPACIVCATTMHKVCNVVTVTENAAKSHQTCVNLEDIHQTVETVLDNIEKIKTDREENLTKMLLQKNTIEKEMHSMRKKMNEHLDHIEKEIIGELNETFRKHKNETDHLLKNIDHRKQGIRELQNTIVKAKTIETDVEAFLVGKRIEQKISEEEKFVDHFYNDESIKQSDFEFKLSPAINSFFVDIKSFGDIIVRKTPSRVNLIRTAHKVKPPEVGFQLARHVSHIKLRLHEKTYNATGIQDLRPLPHIYGGLQRQTTM